MKGVGNVQQTLGMLGVVVTATALCALAVRFSPEHKAREAALRDLALGANNSVAN
jgi:NNP family nitrate/nitrite transporter-like MFS transporter